MAHDQPESFFRFLPLGSAIRFAEEIHDIIDHAPFFERLSFQEVKAMCSFMDCYAAERGSVLIREGERSRELLLVLTGSVDVVRRGSDGGRDRIAKVGPGHVLGEVSLIDGMPRTASCIADEPVDFVLLTRDALDEILAIHPRLGNKILLLLLNLFSERVRHALSLAAPNTAAFAV